MLSKSLEDRKDSLEQELSDLIDVKHMIEGELFQKFFASPIILEDKALKNAYECENMEELNFVKGKHEGLRKLTSIVDEIESRMKFIRHDLEKIV